MARTKYPTSLFSCCNFLLINQVWLPTVQPESDIVCHLGYILTTASHNSTSHYWHYFKHIGIIIIRLIWSACTIVWQDSLQGAKSVCVIANEIMQLLYYLLSSYLYNNKCHNCVYSTAIVFPEFDIKTFVRSQITIPLFFFLLKFPYLMFSMQNIGSQKCSLLRAKPLKKENH